MDKYGHSHASIFNDDTSDCYKWNWNFRLYGCPNVQGKFKQNFYSMTEVTLSPFLWIMSQIFKRYVPKYEYSNFQFTDGKVWPLVNILCVVAVFFACFLDNVTTALLITPVTIRWSYYKIVVAVFWPDFPQVVRSDETQSCTSFNVCGYVFEHWGCYYTSWWSA